MSLDPAVREVAERVLTPRQLDVFVLWLAGCSPRRISTMLDPPVTRSTVKSHLEDVHVRLLAAGVRKRDDGSYYLEEAA